MSLRLARKQGGFTLLELLIVIVIIGILALVIIPGLASGPARARDAQRKQDLSVIKNALETYFNDNNSYPSASATFVVPKDNAAIVHALIPNYLKKIPDDPKAGNHYWYKCTVGAGAGPCTGYILETSLENSKDSQINDPNFDPPSGTGGNGYEVTSVN